MAELVYTYINPVRQRDIDRAVDVLNHSGVIAYPTDLNWAFACAAHDGKALQRIHLLKPLHPKAQPLALICKDISMASEVASIDQACYRILRKILPGPYTVLLPRHKALPKLIHDKRRTVGIRIIVNPLINAILSAYGKPLATTSVPPFPNVKNPEASLEMHFGYQVDEIYGHGIDLILDLGEEMRGQESSIIDFTEEGPRVLRHGAGDVSMFE